MANPKSQLCDCEGGPEIRSYRPTICKDCQRGVGCGCGYVYAPDGSVDNFEPCDRHTLTESGPHAGDIADAITDIIGTQEDGTWNVAPFRWKSRIMLQLARLDGILQK